MQTALHLAGNSGETSANLQAARRSHCPVERVKSATRRSLAQKPASLFFYSFLLPNQQRAFVDLVINFDRDLPARRDTCDRFHINLHGSDFLLPLAISVFDLYMVPNC